MNRSLINQVTLGAIAIAVGIGLAACGGAAPPAANKGAADEVTASWVKAFDAGDAAALTALYAEDAHTTPAGGAAIIGRSDIEAYWSQDLGSGGAVTKLTPVDSLAQGDLLYVDGSYEVSSKDGGAALAMGQYQQLWNHAGGQWKIQQEIWRLDPSLQRNPKMAEQMTSRWMTAYNASDAASLMSMYDNDAELSTQPEGRVSGKAAIEAFWTGDFGDSKPATTLTLTDVYVAGELAHLEGEYSVVEKGQATKGRYVQLWMRDGNEWRIHREMWWK